jgi:hypothetical protein
MEIVGRLAVLTGTQGEVSAEAAAGADGKQEAQRQVVGWLSGVACAPSSECCQLYVHKEPSKLNVVRDR